MQKAPSWDFRSHRLSPLGLSLGTPLALVLDSGRSSRILLHSAQAVTVDQEGGLQTVATCSPVGRVRR